jgi:D-alanine-D-alanine ligase
VFYGGSPSNYDLSSETGVWVCQYIPRSKYDVTPVQITPYGQWRVPIGNLPRSGPVRKTMQMLAQAVRPLAPPRALDRLLGQPMDGIVTVVRGRGGDDGSMHSLGRTLNIPVIGSPLSTCQQTSNKHLFSQAVSQLANTPYSVRYRRGTPAEHIIEDARSQFVPPLFVKPATEEGSYGIEYVDNLDELAAAVHSVSQKNDVLLQERMPGMEISLTLLQDKHGKLHSLPPTLIQPRKAPFYDSLSKRRRGRATLHSLSAQDNPILVEAVAIARDVYDELGCRGMASVDMIAGDDIVDVLEVNTVPTFSDMTPLKYQLKAGNLHPSALLDHIIRRSLEADQE